MVPFRYEFIHGCFNYSLTLRVSNDCEIRIFGYTNCTFEFFRGSQQEYELLEKIVYAINLKYLIN